MSTTGTIFRRELNGYFSSPVAYIVILAFLGVTHWLFFRTFFLANQSSLRPFFSLLPWIFLFLGPALTMRAWAEEKKLGTLEVLMTFPVREREAVLAKFLAAFTFLVITLGLTLSLPLTVMAVGSPDPGPMWGGYLGACLLGGAYLAIGLFASSLTENQIVAFILAITVCFVLLVIGEDIVLFSLPAALVPLCAWLGLGAHFESIGRGVIDSRDILYYLSVIVFFLFLNQLALESRKWR
ncbi:MAG: ABC transporter [Deltaproteobacteria bacterium]|nr:ABC transporter [Deltaproteobacteria bacterium]